MEKHAKFPSGKAVKAALKALKQYRPRGRGQWASAAKVFVKGFVRPGRKAPVKGLRVVKIPINRQCCQKKWQELRADLIEATAGGGGRKTATCEINRNSGRKSRRRGRADLRGQERH